MNRIKWIKPNGNEIETNDAPATVAAAKDLGWTREDEAESNDAAVDARGLPWDARINTANKSQDGDGNWKYKKGVTAETAAQVEFELSVDLVDNAE